MIAVIVLAVAFEKIALVDSFDYFHRIDVESCKGTDEVIDHVLESGATTVLWRNQTGSMQRYPTREDDLRRMRTPLDKRRFPNNTWPHGWGCLERGETNLFAYALSVLSGRGIVPGVHYPFEENHAGFHWSICPWNWDHPQYWCRFRDGAPFYGRVSFGYDEVLEHKLKIVDELIGMGSEVIFLDLFRDGLWSVEQEYTDKMIAEFKAEYGHEPSANDKDPEWLAQVGRYAERYLRGIRARCDAAPRKVRFLIGLEWFKPGEAVSHCWEKYAINWPKLAADGVFDGVVVSGVVFDRKDPWGSTKKAYLEVYEKRGRAKVYYPLAEYDFQMGIPSYAESSGISQVEAAARLLSLAKECGGSGVTMECVDDGNYTQFAETIRNFK